MGSTIECVIILKRADLFRLDVDRLHAQDVGAVDASGKRRGAGGPPGTENAKREIKIIRR